MKLSLIEVQGRKALAVTINDRTFEIAALAKHYGIDALTQIGNDLISEVIEDDEKQAAVADLVQNIAEDADSEKLAVQEPFTWLPPIRRPGKVLGVAMNNSASDARKISAPDHPAFFIKPSSCLIGHEQPIKLRSYYGSVHPEPEMALIISKRVKDVSPEDAWDAIFGYTIFNDITGNDMRNEDRFHYWALFAKKDNPDELERHEHHVSYAARYKGSDGFGPIGPWIVTADEIDDPHNLAVTCWHKGEVIARDSTAYLTKKANEIIAFISKYHTLEPGDIISLGTAFRPEEGSKRSLHTANMTRLGGPVTVEIEKIGRLNNPVEVT